MNIITINKLGANYIGRDIFINLDWAIGDRDRVGLVGPNGAGKSTLLKLIVGDEHPEAGHIMKSSGLQIGYLPQIVSLQSGLTVLEAASILPPTLKELEARLMKIEGRLSDPKVYNDMDKLDRVLAQQETLLEEYEAAGGSRFNGRVRELLHHLGFSEDDHNLITDTLSGGQKKLVALVRLAAEQPDLLLLDEPDNHLDLAGKRRLESFIRNYPGAVVIVSHDRYLLDEVVSHIAELENGKLTLYVGNYSAYAQEREHRRLLQEQQRVTQQKEIARIETAIKRFELWAHMTEDPRHIRQARSRRKMLDKMEERGEIIEKVYQQRRMSLQIEGWRGSKQALKVEELSMGFDDDLLFVDLNFLIRHGERVGLVGANGAGKSVLFRILLDELEPLEGEVTIGNSTEVGYYAQEHQTLAKWLPRTPLDLMRDIKVWSEGDAVAFLMKFQYSYDQVRDPISNLSGGERSRLQLARLMLTRPNLLLMDEPTNNLDIVSSEVLESVMEDFEGAMLVISHDRYFLDRTVDRLLILEDGGIREFDGNYTDWIERG